MNVEFWFDFSCPYAYLAAQRIEEICARHGAPLSFHPMLLGGVFRAIGAGEGPMATLSASKAASNAKDMRRWATLFEVPFAMPAKHPMRTVRALRTLLGLPAANWRDAIFALYAAYWQRGEDVTSDAVIRSALVDVTGAGIEAAVVDAALAGADSDAIKDELRKRTDEAVALGVFGAPAMIVRRTGQPILLWGQDRLNWLDAILGGWDPDGTVGPKISAPAPATSSARVKRVKMDFFFDIASPNAYLGSTQIERFARAAGAELVLKPVLLGALFRNLGTVDVPWFAMPANKRAYVGREFNRWATWWQVPWKFPSRFPQRTVTAQRMMLLAGDKALPLMHRLFRAMWVEDRDLADFETLASMAAEVGLPRDIVSATENPTAKDALKNATAEAQAAGVFGVPTMIVHGATDVLLWGQDRLDLIAPVVAGTLT